MILKKYLKLFRGESLIEVITAIFVLVIGSSIATSIVVTSTQSNSFNRDNLIALNLAIEGVEAIRGVRDNNWLRFSFDKANCWNIIPEETNCSSSKTIESADYTIGLDTSYAWKLNKTGDKKLDLNEELSKNSDFQLKLQDRSGQNIYVSNAITGDKKDSQFYRMVTISYAGTTMNITSTVQWLFQGRKHEITINDQLVNYQNIK